MLASVYTTTGLDPYLTEVEFYLEDVRGQTRKLTGRGRGGLPFLSTDSVRFVVSFGNTTNNRKYWYSPFFKMRPNSLLGDSPPMVNLITPHAGDATAPGAIVPITWTASDDEGLRAFDLIASYDNGRTWNPIVRDLPGDVRSYNWQTAPGTGYASVRVMVIAKDLRFQSSSDDGTMRPLASVSAVSRKTHGSVGTFDINLPLSGEPGVECRSGASTGDHQVVITFSSPVTATSARMMTALGSVTGMSVQRHGSNA